MSKLTWFIVILICVFLVVVFAQAQSVDASVDYEDPGFPWGEYRVTWRSADLQHYKLMLVNGPNSYCEVELKADCVEPEKTAPAVGAVCLRTGNQKFECPGDTQTLRWTETIQQECWAFAPKTYKCPPCPVCETLGSDSVECTSCMGLVGGE